MFWHQCFLRFCPKGLDLAWSTGAVTSKPRHVLSPPVNIPKLPKSPWKSQKWKEGEILHRSYAKKNLRSEKKIDRKILDFFWKKTVKFFGPKNRNFRKFDFRDFRDFSKKSKIQKWQKKNEKFFGRKITFSKIRFLQIQGHPPNLSKSLYGLPVWPPEVRLLRDWKIELGSNSGFGASGALEALQIIGTCMVHGRSHIKT